MNRTFSKQSIKDGNIRIIRSVRNIVCDIDDKGYYTVTGTIKFKGIEFTVESVFFSSDYNLSWGEVRKNTQLYGWYVI